VRISTAAPRRDPLYRGYRFPAEVISHAVWLYFRFALSHRDVEELLAERGVQVSFQYLFCQEPESALCARRGRLETFEEVRHRAAQVAA
jgi:hypothetical protein